MSDANEAKARKLEKRHRDLCALADGGATAAEADTARTLARRVAKQIRALGWEPGALQPLVDVETSIPGFEHLDPRPAPRPTAPTIEVHGNRHRSGAVRKPYKIAAPYWCPRCGHGRVTPYCALCDTTAEEVIGGGMLPDEWS